jgi:2-methylcitrate dehydratase PrpD
MSDSSAAASSTATIAETLAGFVTALAPQQIPTDVSERAAHLLLDAIGCALAARGEVFATTLAKGVQALAGEAHDDRHGSGVIGHAARLPLRDAMLLNGMLAHGLDYDDTHTAGIVHLTVSLLPTLLGLCGERRASGSAMLTAYVAAVEAGARIASAAKGGFHAQGFHPTGLVGAFASTLAAGRVMGLSADRLAHAQGVVLSMGSGSLQFLEDGAWTKRMHPGWAAQAGFTAATLAAHGMPAPLAAYEGRYGLYNLCLSPAGRAAADLSLATAGLDAAGGCTRWELMNIAVKPFAICHLSHACTDAAIALHRGGLDVAQIVSVEAIVPAGIVPVVCEPLAAKRRPQGDYDAKFSLPYAIASGLLRGRLGLQELKPEAYQDVDALALMDRIGYVFDADTTFPRHYSGALRVTLNDGRVLTQREAINRGHAERPLTNADVRAKFFENASLHFPIAHAEAICDQLLALDRLGSVAALESLLAQAPSSFR